MVQIKPYFVGQRIASLEPRRANRNSLHNVAFNVGHHEGKGDRYGTTMVTMAFWDDSNCNRAGINAKGGTDHVSNNLGSDTNAQILMKNIHIC